MFEENMAEYTGAKYAVACDNCTNALRMCCELFEPQTITIPSETYLSVPQSIIQAGHKVAFDKTKDNWRGIYQLYPLPIYDAAKRLTSNMYIEGSLMCLSFGIKKPLKLGKGGMILTDSYEYSNLLKKKRWSGRTEGIPMYTDNMPFLGYNAYMSPDVAAWGLMMLNIYPKNVPDESNEYYPSLERYDIFK